MQQPQPPQLTPMQQAMALAAAHTQAATQAAAAAEAAAAAAAPAAAASTAASSEAASSVGGAGAVPPPPTKSLLIRVKRKRGDAPLETLVVTSSRAEKRAALDELRTSFEHAAAIHEGDSAAAAQAAVERSASAGAASSAAFDAKAATGAAPVRALSAASGAAAAAAPSPSSSAASPTSAGGFSLKPAAPQTATHRIFKLLTTISAPKDQHATDDKIQARIAQMKQARALLHPALQVTADQVHQKRLLAQQLSTQEKRELLLQRNRDRAALLNDTPLPKQRALLHNSDELQVKIVDIQLPGAPAPDRTTFQPPPLSQAASTAAAREHQRQLRRSHDVAVEGSSHRSVGSSSTVTPVDPAIAAAEFTRAMASIKRMPQIGRAQMNAYQSLIEDMLASQPPSVAQEVQRIKQQESKEQQPAPAQPMAAEEEETPRTQSPRLNRVEPKIPLRRRKKDPAAASTAAASSSAAAAPAAAAPVPTPLPLSFVSTPDAGVSAHLSPMKPVFSAGGVSFDPNQLVPATGFSMHPPTDAPQPVGIVTGGDESDDVWDVYAVDDDDTVPSTPALASATQANAGLDARLPHPHVHGSSTSVPLSSILPGSSSAKVRYDGSSSAYVVLGDGLFQWTGADEDCTVEDELAAEDEGDVEDDSDKEQSDYGDEEDSSAEEEHEDQIRRVRDDDPDDTPWVAAGGRALSDYRAHDDLRTVMHDRKTRQQPHGFYPEGPDEAADEEDDDYIVKEVRRTMRGGHPSLSSDDDDDVDGGCDDDGLCRPRRLRPDEAQDDQEYTDAIQDEEDMDFEREDNEEEDD